jgi:hypothetical protein
MRLNKATLCLSALLVLGGCDDPPPNPPNPVPNDPAKLTTITVTCGPDSAAAISVVAGRSVQCMAKATDQYGANFEVSGFHWTSSNESVAVVSQTGKVTAFLAGPAVTIGATPTGGAAPEQKSATLTVNPATPTLHTASITTAETWREAENPHVVRGSIEVNGATAPLLTLEAGVVVLFEQDAELRFTNGALQAQGSPDAPIYMLANQVSPPKGYWRGVVFATAGSSSGMNHVTLSDCGNGSGKGACLSLEAQAAPVLRNVTVRNSGTAGVMVANDGSAFGTGSTMLNVAGSTGHAVSIGANQAATLPTGGAFMGNTPNAVELKGNVVRSQTWPNPGIPYAINEDLHVEDTSAPTLTLSAGTVLRFGPDSGLFVGYDSAPGKLIIAGTETAPVLLTSGSADPKPGDWKGVFLGEMSSDASQLTHATIEYAGALRTPETTRHVSLSISGLRVRPVINNVTVQKSSGTGVQLGGGGSIGAGSTKLISRDNGGYAVSLAPPELVRDIPANSIFSGNTLNAVELSGGSVLTSQTWPNFGVPYLITLSIGVGSSSNPTLTLQPGTELRFANNTGLWIGSDGEPGALIAVGTAEKPIRFVPNAAEPVFGQTWRGLSFWLADGSKLDHVSVSHGGMVGKQGMGNLNVYREIGPFVTNSTFSDSAVCGITVSDGRLADSTPVTTDFTLAAYQNTFIRNDQGDQCLNF